MELKELVPGRIVRHKLTKNKLLVCRIGREDPKVECRDRNHEIHDFYPEELESLEE